MDFHTTQPAPPSGLVSPNTHRRPGRATLTRGNVDVSSEAGKLRGIELTTSQAHREDDIGSLTAINMTLPALLVMVSFGSGLGQKIIVE
jgi:hypothetical protein